METYIPGDVLFAQTRGFWAFLIRVWTGSPFTHCAVCLGDGTICEADAAYGTRIAPIAYDRYVVMRDQTLTDDERRLIVGWCRSIVGSQYDWAEVADLVAGKFLKRAPRLFTWGRFICTRVVLAGWQRVGKLMELGPGPYTPGELKADLPFRVIANVGC